MPFTSLKRKLPASEKTCVSLDDFINEAEAYALGKSNNVVALPAHKQDAKIEKKIHATFSLSIEAKQKLDGFSVQCGISRSRLIRIWLDNLDTKLHENMYVKSQVD